MRGNLLQKIAATGLCFVFCTTGLLIAGDKAFSVTSYIPEKFTDFEWRIDGKLNFGGNDSDLDADRVDDGVKAQESGNASQSADVRSNLTYEHITLPVQFFSTTSLFTSFDYYTSNQASETDFGYSIPRRIDSDTRSRDIDVGLSQHVQATVYPQNTFFVALDADLSYLSRNNPTDNVHSFEKLFYDSTSAYDIRTQNSNRQESASSNRYRINGQLTQGLGRVEYGIYGATALYMIDELESRGLLLRKPDYDEMTHLTDLIYHYRETRAIDSRLLKIEALTAFLDYLKEIGSVAESGPAAVLAIVDVWDYFPKDRRSFGWSVGGGAGIDYERIHNDATDELGIIYSYYYYGDDDLTVLDSVVTNPEYNLHRNVVTTETDKAPYWIATAAYHRPFSLRWQFDGGGSARYYFSASDDSKTVTNQYLPYSRITTRESKSSIDKWYNVELSGAVTYIMNSRTQAHFGGSYSYSNREYTTQLSQTTGSNINNGSASGRGSTTSSIRLDSQLEYRLAIPTTLVANLNFTHTDNDATIDEHTENVTRSNWTISAQLVHYLY